MTIVEPLTMPLIVEAVTAENFKHTIDEDGDLQIVWGRDKGKDIYVYVSNPDRTDGYLVIWSIVYRFFREDRVPTLLTVCNTWNRERRIGRAFLSNPDADGDYTVRFDHHIVCKHGAHRELIQENLSMFSLAASLFWNELDAAT